MSSVDDSHLAAKGLLVPSPEPPVPSAGCEFRHNSIRKLATRMFTALQLASLVDNMTVCAIK